MCKIDQHYFPYIENTYITSYYINHCEELQEKEDGHPFIKKHERTNDRFLDSYKLVNLLMTQKDKVLTEVSAEVIQAHICVPLDVEKVYDYDIKQHCRPVPNDIKEPQSKDAINIRFDSETFNTKRKNTYPIWPATSVNEMKVKTLYWEKVV